MPQLVLFLAEVAIPIDAWDIMVVAEERANRQAVKRRMVAAKVFEHARQLREAERVLRAQERFVRRAERRWLAKVRPRPQGHTPRSI